jgi:hypothetical protein
MENDKKNTDVPAAAVASQADKPVDAVSQIVDEIASKSGMQVKTAVAIKGILAPVANGTVDEKIVNMLAQALSRDEDLKNADSAGYIRGRNEKIDVINRFDSDEPSTTGAGFPRYNKKSFWDDIS